VRIKEIAGSEDLEEDIEVAEVSEGPEDHWRFDRSDA
jgi:hypothetical protein